MNTGFIGRSRRLTYKLKNALRPVQYHFARREPMPNKQQIRRFAHKLKNASRWS